jgi:hypothetical protein
MGAPPTDAEAISQSLCDVIADQVAFCSEKNLMEEGLRGTPVLHGLALVLWLLRPQGAPCAAEGGLVAPLLIHMLERFLRDLRRRECYPSTVFFHCDRLHLSVSQRIAYDLVYHHLCFLAESGFAPELRPACFTSSASVEWMSFLGDTVPSIALSTLPDMQISPALRFSIGSVLCSLWARSCSVAPLEDISFAGPVITGSLLIGVATPSALAQQLAGMVHEHTLPPLIMWHCSQVSNQLPASTSLLPSSHEDLALQALPILTVTPASSFLSRIALLALLLQQQLELTERALVRVSASDPQGRLGQFLDSMFSRCSEALQAPASADKPSAPCLFDILDSSMLLYLLHFACQQTLAPGVLLSDVFKLSPQLLARCEASWCKLHEQRGDVVCSWNTTVLPPVCSWLTCLAWRQAHAAAAPLAALQSSGQLCNSCAGSRSATPISAAPVAPLVPPQASTAVVDSWEELDSVALAPSEAVPSPAPPVLSSAPPEDTSLSSPEVEFALYPLHSALLDAALKLSLPHLSETDPCVLETYNGVQQFEEKYHWHSRRLLSAPKGPLSKSQQRQRHLQASVLHLYSLSLLGVRQSRAIADPEPSSKKVAASPKEQRLRDENEKALLTRHMTAVESRFEGVLEQIQRAGTARSEAADQADEEKTLAMRTKRVVALLLNAYAFVKESFPNPTPALKELLQLCSRLLPAVPAKSLLPIQFRLSLDLQGLEPTALLPGLQLDVRAQMQLCGEMMRWRQPPVSEETSRADILRYGFVPEVWQHRMIRCIDERRSVLVCAPTSSGKTFIAFYVIESVLRADEDATIAFVVFFLAALESPLAEHLSGANKGADESSLRGDQGHVHQEVQAFWTRTCSPTFPIASLAPC